MTTPTNNMMVGKRTSKDRKTIERNKQHMAAKIEWHKVPSRAKDAEPRFFPRIKKSEVIRERELFKKASTHSVIDRATFSPAIYELMHAIAEELKKGNTVSIQDLGTFQLQIGTEQAIGASERANTQAIKVEGVRYTPSPLLIDLLKDTEFTWEPEEIATTPITDEQVMEQLSIWFSTHDSITRSQFCALLHMRRTTATKRINSLISKGIITRLGANRDTKYIPSRANTM